MSICFPSTILLRRPFSPPPKQFWMCRPGDLFGPSLLQVGALTKTLSSTSFSEETVKRVRALTSKCGHGQLGIAGVVWSDFIHIDTEVKNRWRDGDNFPRWVSILVNAL